MKNLRYYTSNIKSGSLYQEGNRRIPLFSQNIIYLTIENKCEITNIT